MKNLHTRKQDRQNLSEGEITEVGNNFLGPVLNIFLSREKCRQIDIEMGNILDEASLKKNPHDIKKHVMQDTISFITFDVRKEKASLYGR